MPGSYSALYICVSSCILMLTLWLLKTNDTQSSSILNVFFFSPSKWWSRVQTQAWVTLNSWAFCITQSSSMWVVWLGLKSNEAQMALFWCSNLTPWNWKHWNRPPDIAEKSPTSWRAIERLTNMSQTVVWLHLVKFSLVTSLDHNGWWASNWGWVNA